MSVASTPPTEVLRAARWLPAGKRRAPSMAPRSGSQQGMRGPPAPRQAAMVPATPTGASSPTGGNCPSALCGIFLGVPGDPTGLRVTGAFLREDQGQNWQLLGRREEAVAQVMYLWSVLRSLPPSTAQVPPVPVASISGATLVATGQSCFPAGASLKFGARPCLSCQQSWWLTSPPAPGHRNLSHQPASSVPGDG